MVISLTNAPRLKIYKITQSLQHKKKIIIQEMLGKSAQFLSNLSIQIGKPICHMITISRKICALQFLVKTF